MTAKTKRISVGQAITILANFGVIVGIVFLVVELQQNNQQLELQSYQAWIDANLQINALMSDPIRSEILAEGYVDSRNLSNETYIAFAMINTSVMQMAQSTDFLYRSGSIGRSLWNSEMNRAAGILSLPGAQAWWQAGGRTQLSPEFVQLIESIDTNICTWAWDAEQGFHTETELVEACEEYLESIDR